MRKPMISVDLDGTLLTDSWPEMGTWMPGAQEALRSMSDIAHVVVFTCRIAPVSLDGVRRLPALVQKEINAIRVLLDDAGFPDVEIWNKPWKPPAIVYIDNRGMKYNGHSRSWDRLLPQVLNMCGEFEKAMEAYDAADELHDGAGDHTEDALAFWDRGA